jgi:acyl-CoA synthetase (AMP-forming)/AMP-acid ligase II
LNANVTEARTAVIHRSRYAEPVIPALSLPAFVLEHAGAFGDRPALVDGSTGETVSYRDLPGRVASAATALVSAGVGTGDVVALLASNQPGWAIALYGALTAGARVTPINPAFTVDEIAHHLLRSGASLVVADAGVADKADAAATSAGVKLMALPDLVAISSLTGDTARPSEAAVHLATARPSDPNQVAVIPFSSGTTGLPKGVMLTHRNLVATLRQHEGIYHVGSDDVLLAALPFFHIYGLSIILGYGLRHGATIVTLPRFDPQRWLSLIETQRVTWLHVAPPMILLLTSPEAAQADLTSLRHVVSGAAPLDSALTARAEARIGCRIGQGYGMTEASPGVTWTPDDGSVDCPPGSVGVLVAGTEARVVDPATGADTDAAGELWVRGPQVMAGYLDDPSASSATIVDGGWMRTGDIVEVDGVGVIRVVDRLKELIKYKGYQVAPAELEAILLEHPAVADAAVVGVPDLAAGEIPKAFVVLDSPVSSDDLLAWVAARVAPYKKIRLLEVIDAIPRSVSGKILRKQLKVDG